MKTRRGSDDLMALVQDDALDGAVSRAAVRLLTTLHTEALRVDRQREALAASYARVPQTPYVNELRRIDLAYFDRAITDSEALTQRLQAVYSQRDREAMA